MASLGQPITLPCGVVLKNRLVKASMTEGLADNYLRATQRHNHLYARWADGGTGLLLTGNVMVDRRHLERPGNVAIEDRLGVKQLESWAKAGTANQTHLWMQINHPGRQTPKYVTKAPVSASDVELGLSNMFARPRPLKEPEIEDIVDRFGFVARIARETGFTGVQIHAAHGYLLNQFLSPVTNQRKDQYGGALKARAKLLLDIVRNVRSKVGAAYPVAVKINSADFQKGGFSAEDSRQVVAWLVEEGIDLLEISGGSYEQPKMFDLAGDKGSYQEAPTASTARREAYFLDFARQIRAICKVPLLVTGGFRTSQAMESALEEGACDLIGLARPYCVATDLAQQILNGLMTETPRIEQTLRLGRWQVLGPNSPFRLIKMINGFGQQAWFCEQIRRLASGQEADMKLGLLSALRAYQANEMAAAKAIQYLAR